MAARRLQAVPDQPGRVVAYIRVSALMGRGGEDFHSPDVQLSSIRRLTTGMREVAVIDDIDQTGRNFNREGIDKIRAMAEARQIDVVAVHDLSRVGRNVREALAFIDHLARHGVGVISASENIDTSTPAGRLMLQQFLSFAEFYSNVVGKNWSAIIARRAEQGHGHGRAMGYVKKDLAIHVHPVDGPAMARAFERYAAGDPIGEITRRLSAEVGRTVYAVTLKKQFRNEVYRGRVNSLGRVLPGKHEPLVCEPTWQLVQERLERDSSTPSRHLGPTWSLVGITYCPQDHLLQRNPRADVPGGPKIDRLICGRGRAGVSESCTVGTPHLSRIEAKVLADVAEYVRLLRDDVGARAEKQMRVSSAKADRVGLEQQLVATRAAMAKVTTRWGMDQLDDATYEQAMAELRDSETALAAAIGAAVEVARMPSPVQVAHAGERLLAMWDDMTIPERNRALRTVVRKVVVRAPERWREPEADRTQVFFF